MESAAEVSAWSRPATAAKIVGAGWWIAVFAVGAQTVAQLTNGFLLGHAQSGLDAGTDRNAFDWMSFAAAMSAALSLVLLSLVGVAHRKSTAMLALFVAFLAIDDLTNLHDNLGTGFAATLPAPFDRVGDWSTPLLYLPLLTVSFLLLCRQTTRAVPPAATQMRAAIALLAGAVALRVVVGVLEIAGVQADDALQTLGVAVLEGAELGAWVLLASSLAADAADLVGRSNARTNTPR